MRKYIFGLALIATQISFAITPAFVSLEGWRKSDGQRVFYSGTLTESEAAQGKPYFTIQEGYFGDNEFMAYSSDRVYITKRNGSVAFYHTIDFRGKPNPYNFGDWGELTNCWISWSAENGIWLRLQNTTKYPAKLVDVEGGITYNLPAGIGCTASIRDYWPRVYVDTSSATVKPTVRLKNTDINKVIATASSFKNYALYYNKGGIGKVVIEDITETESIYPIIFSDNTNDPIYGKTNTILYADMFVPCMETNVMAWTEWAFNQSETLQYVGAYINDICVCSGHSTSHLIDYPIYTGDPSAKYDKKSHSYIFEYTMSLKPQEGHSYGSAPCNFRTWIGAATFDEAETECRSEYECDWTKVVKFRIRFRAMRPGSWKVEFVSAQ